jgi:hypothetical protein
MKHNLSDIETELKKRLIYPYKWLQKQNDNFDKQTNFIYDIFNFDETLKEIEKRFKHKESYELYFNYSLNRWFNFWSAYAVEKIFCSLPNVKPAFNHRDRLKDFSIYGINFDHKTTVYPRRFSIPINIAKENPATLIKWLYENQSSEKRKHYHNRLFIILFDINGEHWKLKAEIIWLKELIENYVSNFDSNHLISLQLKKDFVTYSDIIWAIK